MNSNNGQLTDEEKALRHAIEKYGPLHFAESLWFDLKRFFDRSLPKSSELRRRVRRPVGWTVFALVGTAVMVLGGSWLTRSARAPVLFTTTNSTVQNGTRQAEQYWTTFPTIPANLHWTSLSTRGGTIRRVWVPVPPTWTSTRGQGLDPGEGWGARQVIGTSSVGYGMTIQTLDAPIDDVLQGSMGPIVHWRRLPPIVSHERRISPIGEAMGDHQVRELESISNGTHTLLIEIYVPSSKKQLLRTIMADIRFSFAR